MMGFDVGGQRSSHTRAGQTPAGFPLLRWGPAQVGSRRLTALTGSDGLELLITPAAILLSAFLAWLCRRSISAGRATADFMAAAEVADEVLVKARARFAELSGNGGEALLGLVSPREPDELQSAALVSVCLNHCGLVGVSIRNRAMDEQIHKRWSRTTCTRTWGRAEAVCRGQAKNAAAAHSLRELWVACREVETRGRGALSSLAACLQGSRPQPRLARRVAPAHVVPPREFVHGGAGAWDSSRGRFRGGCASAWTAGLGGPGSLDS